MIISQKLNSEVVGVGKNQEPTIAGNKIHADRKLNLGEQREGKLAAFCSEDETELACCFCCSKQSLPSVRTPTITHTPHTYIKAGMRDI